MASDADKTVNAERKTKIFISYSRVDLAFVDRLEAALKEHGLEAMLDRTDIYAFEDWWQRIQGLIEQADTVVFVLSPDAVESSICAKEVDYAASLNKRFAPIVYRSVSAKAIPQALARLNFIFFDKEEKFDESLSELSDALQTDIAWVRQHTEFGEAARRWVAAGRSNGLLLRSLVLEEAERWIASRPPGAPEPTAETQAFVVDSRRGATRRRNVLTGSLAAGLVVALVLAGLAYWQRGIAVEQQRLANEQRQLAEQQQKRAEDTLAAATKAANSLVFDLAHRFKDSIGVPAALVKDILDRARALQEQLIKSGEVTPELRRSEGAALVEMVGALQTVGDTAGALAAAQQARQIFTDLLTQNPASTDYQRQLSAAFESVGNVQVDRGDLGEALQSYRDSLRIRERLAISDPGNAVWQGNLALSYEGVGDVQAKQGDSAGALKSYRDSGAIFDRVVKSGHAEWQDDLAVTYTKAGLVQMGRGELDDALQSFRDSLAIKERLAQSNPGNGRWQHELSLSYEEVGDVQAKKATW